MHPTITIEPEKIYTKEALAAAFGVSTKSIERWTKGRRPQLPRPNQLGREPVWRGETILRHLDRRQKEAEAA